MVNFVFLFFHREVWVQSSKLYPLSLTLKQLQDLLQDTQGIETACFNMAVRVNATDEVLLFKDNPCHYMDLKFCVSSYVKVILHENHISLYLSIIVLMNLTFFTEHSDRLHERPKASSIVRHPALHDSENVWLLAGDVFPCLIVQIGKSAILRKLFGP